MGEEIPSRAAPCIMKSKAEQTPAQDVQAFKKVESYPCTQSTSFLRKSQSKQGSLFNTVRFLDLNHSLGNGSLATIFICFVKSKIQVICLVLGEVVNMECLAYSCPREHGIIECLPQRPIILLLSEPMKGGLLWASQSNEAPFCLERGSCLSTQEGSKYRHLEN